MTRIQTPSHGFQVYIFQADAERMRANRSTRWSLFGLWTHSSCPVIQHVRNAEENRGQDVKVKFGIELLGHCVDSSRREGQGYTNQSSQTIDGRKLTIYNHGTRLEPVLTEGSGRQPARNCYIKELPMESPFNLDSSRTTSYRARHQETNTRPPRQTVEREECHTKEIQWYSTSSGSEKLRRIQDHCRDNLSRKDKVEINRDSSSHDIQLSIEHNRNTFLVDFPSNFPTTQARLSFTNVYNPSAAVDRNDMVKSEKDIMSVIRKYCTCYQCKW